MKKTLMVVACAAVVAGCGGGGNDSPSTSGEWHAYTTDGTHFAVTLDFNAMTYSYTADARAHSGKLVRAGSSETYNFSPSGSPAGTAYPGYFTIADNVVVGSIPLAAAGTAFIAAKTFVTNLADVSGARFEVMTRSVGAGYSAGSSPARWTIYRVDSATSTMRSCTGGTDAGMTFVSGVALMTDPDACPAGSVASNYGMAANGAKGGFIKTVSGVAGAAPTTSEVRFAKVGANYVYLAAPTSLNATDAAFSIGVSGVRGDATGSFATGQSSLGYTTSMVFGPAAGAVALYGGSVAAPGAASSAGTLATLPAVNAMLYTPSGSAGATSGLLLTPGLAVLGNFMTKTGDLTIFLR